MKILIWEARTSKRISLTRLSQWTGISKSTLSRIENEKTSPSMNQMEVIAKALECNISDLYYSEYM